MFERQNIVTVIREGKPSAAYIGPDAELAEKAYAKASADLANEDVRLYRSPAYSRFATPAANAASLKAEQAERDAEQKRLKELQDAKSGESADREKKATARTAQEKKLLQAIDEAESALGSAENAGKRVAAEKTLKAAVQALRDFQNPPAPAKDAEPDSPPKTKKK